MVYSAKTDLKAEVASSYLNWMWWILDPLLFMFVYTFIVQIIFGSSQPNLPVFVFIGLSSWKFFESCMNNSVKLIRSNSSIISKIYIPKYILLVSDMLVYLFKYFISISLVAVLMIIYRIPPTWNILYFFPMVLLLFLLSFSFGVVLMHFGVFIKDLAKAITPMLKLVFYMSGVFYSIEGKLPKGQTDILLHFNPVAYILTSLRNCMMYGKAPNWLFYFFWLIISVLTLIWGIYLVRKYENNYIKVI